MNKILEIKFGSHLYGTNTENSDTDHKGIYLPTAKEICLNSYKKTICSIRPKQVGERNIKDDVDIEFFSLDQFMKLLCQGQTVALDMLFSPEFNLKNDILKEIYLNKDKILNKNINAFVGYTKQQAAKYGVKGFRVHALKLVLDLLEKELLIEENMVYPSKNTLAEFDLEKTLKEWDSPHIKLVTNSNDNCHAQKFLEVCDKKLPLNMRIKDAYDFCNKRYDAYGHRAQMAERNEGIDWKAVSHAVRIASQAKELLLTGNVIFPRPDRELLIKIKTGQVPYEEVNQLIEMGLESINISSAQSKLREEPDYEWCEEFIYKVYKKIVNDDELNVLKNLLNN